MAEGEEKVLQLLKSFENVMLTTQGIGDFLDARPMHIAKVETNCDLWFLSGNDGKIAELQKNPQALVVAQDKNDCWLAIAGKVEITNDRVRIKELWKEVNHAWFPGGIDDPNIRVLAFRAERGEYWDQRGKNKIDYVFKVAKAYIKGQTPELETETHETVQL